MQHDAFVSFCHADEHLHQRLIAQLHGRKLRAYSYEVPYADVRAGLNLYETFYREINEAKNFVLLLTQDALNSTWVTFELLVNQLLVHRPLIVCTTLARLLNEDRQLVLEQFARNVEDLRKDLAALGVGAGDARILEEFLQQPEVVARSLVTQLRAHKYCDVIADPDDWDSQAADAISGAAERANYVVPIGFQPIVTMLRRLIIEEARCTDRHRVQRIENFLSATEDLASAARRENWRDVEVHARAVANRCATFTHPKLKGYLGLLVGFCHLMLQDFATAEDVLREASQDGRAPLAETDENVLGAYAAALMQRRKLEAARRVLQRCLEIDSSCRFSHYHLLCTELELAPDSIGIDLDQRLHAAGVAMTLAQPEEAARLLLASLAKAGRFEDLIRLVEEYSTTAEQNALVVAEAIDYAGLLAQRSARRRRTMLQILSEMRTDDQSAITAYAVARAHARLGAIDSAIAIASAARNRSRDIRLYGELCGWMLQADRADDAKKLASEILAKPERYWSSSQRQLDYWRGQSCWLLGHDEDAVTYFDQSGMSRSQWYELVFAKAPQSPRLC